MVPKPFFSTLVLLTAILSVAAQTTTSAPSTAAPTTDAPSTGLDFLVSVHVSFHVSLRGVSGFVYASLYKKYSHNFVNISV